MALKLQYRSTFIDVEEESVQDFKVRARSLPARSRAPATEAQEEESQLSNYVTTLAQRAEQLCVLLRRDGNLAQLKETPTPEMKHGQQRTETSSTATPHDTSDLASLSSKATDIQQSIRRPERRAAFGSGVSVVSGLPGLLEEVMPSEGSIGHPEVCRRPCLYFAAGSCSNGASCGYCHMPHTQRPLHMDKHQREALKQLCDADLLKIVARQMRSRAVEMGFFAEAAEVLSLMDAWATAAAKVPARTALVPHARKLEKLEYHMSRMTFSTLLSLVVRGLKTGSNVERGDQVADALTRMREQLASAGMFELQVVTQQ